MIHGAFGSFNPGPPGSGAVDNDCSEVASAFLDQAQPPAQEIPACDSGVGCAIACLGPVDCTISGNAEGRTVRFTHDLVIGRHCPIGLLLCARLRLSLTDGETT